MNVKTRQQESNTVCVLLNARSVQNKTFSHSGCDWPTSTVIRIYGCTCMCMDSLTCCIYYEYPTGQLFSVYKCIYFFISITLLKLL